MILIIGNSVNNIYQQGQIERRIKIRKNKIWTSENYKFINFDN